LSAENHKSTDVPVVQKPRMRKVCFEDKGASCSEKHLRKFEGWSYLHKSQWQSARSNDAGSHNDFWTSKLFSRLGSSRSM